MTRTPILPPVVVDLSEPDVNRPPILPMGYYPPPRFHRIMRAGLAVSAALVALAIGLTTAGVVLAARAGEPTAATRP